MPETLAIAGSGTIASGLAAVAAPHGEVILWARTDVSAARAEKAIAKHCEKIAEGSGHAAKVRIVSEVEALAEGSVLVEAIAEDATTKGALLAQLGELTGPEQIIATTTSSLSVGDLAGRSGVGERFVGLHVFNPVPRMELVELAFAAETRADVRERARALCATLGKTAVEVPDSPGFVVNRLLFPYLFDAVELMSSTGMSPADIDRCMNLGAGMPMGPMALLDFVGLDVSLAIGETIGAAIPERVRELVAEGAVGRKAGRGFYDYG